MLAFVSRTLGISRLHAGHAVAVAFNVDLGTTSVSVHLAREDEVCNDFLSSCTNDSEFIRHPGFVPLLLAQVEYLETDKALLEMRIELGKLEQELGFSDQFGEMRRSSTSLSRSFLGAMNKKVNIFASRVTAYVERLEIDLLRLQCIREFIKEVGKEVRSKGSWSEPQHALLEEQSQKLMDQIAFLKNGWDIMLVRYRAFHNNAQTQVAVVRQTPHSLS